MIIITSRIGSVFMAGTSYIDRLAQYDEATPGLKGVGYHQKEGGKEGGFINLQLVEKMIHESKR